MKFKSPFTDLKVIHSKGTAHFKDGEFETDEDDIIKELMNNRNLSMEVGLHEEIKSIKSKKQCR